MGSFFRCSRIRRIRPAADALKVGQNLVDLGSGCTDLVQILFEFVEPRTGFVKKVIEENGGTPMMSRVGHAFIKAQMRENNAIFAGELSGHYYFQDNYFAESSSLAALRVAEIVLNSGKTLSELVAPIQRYFASGEINSTVEAPAEVLEKVKSTYSDGNVFELDGVSVEYDEWWCNVRMSNTEPLVRLNLEAKTQELMEEKRDELIALIRS